MISSEPGTALDIDKGERSGFQRIRKKRQERESLKAERITS